MNVPTFAKCLAGICALMAIAWTIREGTMHWPARLMAGAALWSFWAVGVCRRHGFREWEDLWH